MARGFWGDIIQSPYIPFGVEILKEPENTEFRQKVNGQQIYTAVEFSQYNVHNYIKIFEEGQQFNYPFSRLKYARGETPEESKEAKVSEFVKEDEEEPQIQEVTEEQVEQMR